MIQCQGTILGYLAARNQLFFYGYICYSDLFIKDSSLYKWLMGIQISRLLLYTLSAKNFKHHHIHIKYINLLLSLLVAGALCRERRFFKGEVIVL